MGSINENAQSYKMNDCISYVPNENVKVHVHEYELGNEVKECAYLSHIR